MPGMKIANTESECPRCGEPVLVCQVPVSGPTVAHAFAPAPKLFLHPVKQLAIVPAGRDGSDARPAEVYREHACAEPCGRCGSTRALLLCDECGEER